MHFLTLDNMAQVAQVEHPDPLVVLAALDGQVMVMAAKVDPVVMVELVELVVKVQQLDLAAAADVVQ
jgi:hypothetical protein